MPATSSKSAYIRGIAATVPFTLMAAPFGLLFGVVATEAGLNLAQVMGFTIVVIAGAAQFAAIQLMTDAAPALIVIASALAVNLRMMMYSASLQPHIGTASLWQRIIISYTNFDQTYAVAMAEFEARPAETATQKALFFLGASTPMVMAWVSATWVGAVVGTTIPPEFALDFAMPVMFISMIGPALRSLAHIGAALTAVILSLVFAWMPFNLGLIVAALPAMAVGAELERRGYGR